MRDGAPSSEDAADLEALSADGRLVRRVRWQLVAWSGFSTLLVLVVLGDRQAGFAVGGDVDHVAVLLEEAPQCSAQALVILDDQEMHCAPSTGRP